MPRLLKTADRRRCHRACENCRRRKEKCDGLNPCGHCEKRKALASCVYLPKVSRIPRQSKQRGQSSEPVQLRRNLEEPPEKDADRRAACSESTSPTCAPVPQESRVIRNARGRYVYNGDSASLSFLHHARRIVALVVGSCTFTEDVYLSAGSYRHQMLETTPMFKASALRSAPMVDVQQSIELTTHFILATAGILDLFEDEILLGQMRRFACSPERVFRANVPVLKLVLALGAQARASGTLDDYLAESYFHFGLTQAMEELIDEPNIHTVQSFCMITWYALAACRRSVAAIYLGIAVQAAHTIGLHTTESDVVFQPGEDLCRRKAWTALRFCDVYMSASLGRPVTTSNLRRNDTSCYSTRPAEETNQEVRKDSDFATTELCNIFERILSEVYTKRVVTLQLVESIADQLRACSSRLSILLNLASSSSVDQQDRNRAEQLRSSNLIVAYHYSIILLTCPFLTFKVMARLKGDRPGEVETSHPADVTKFSEACVTSAIKGIDAVHQLIQHHTPPRRLPLIINSMLMSALCLGLASFGSHDHRSSLLEDGLKQAVAVLAYFQHSNPQAARYVQIISQLIQATAAHEGQRKQIALRTSSHRFNNLFGGISASSDIQNSTDSRTDSLPQSLAASGQLIIPETIAGGRAWSENANFSLPLFDWSSEHLPNTASGMFLPIYDPLIASRAFQALNYDDAGNVLQEEGSSIEFDPITTSDEISVFSGVHNS